MAGNDVVTNLRAQLKGAHDWLEGTLVDVTDEVANTLSEGNVASIGANYAHVVTAEDYFVNGLLTGGMPIMMSSSAGISVPPPFGGWAEWGRTVHVDIATQQAYAQQVYAATDAWLATKSDADLSVEAETPIGKMPLGAFIGLWILNAHTHAGEISCLKGLRGMKGYPV